MSNRFRPREIWRRHVGGIQSRNNILASNGRIYVSTSGARWNARDNRDGVYCLNASDGTEVWFAPTTADVNEIVFAGHKILAPTDAGEVFVIDRSTGVIETVHRVDSAVLGRPLVYGDENYWIALFASARGRIYRIISGGGGPALLADIGRGVRAALVKAGPASILIADEAGLLTMGDLSATFDQLTIKILVEMPEDKYGDSRSISATPLVVAGMAFVGFSRSTYHDDPALVCVDLVEGKEKWVARCKSNSDGFGNIRTTPILIGSNLIVASAYRDSVDIINSGTGEVCSSITLGQNVFQQWSSPVAVSENVVALARVDGVCSLVDIEQQKLLASISLATAQTEKLRGSTLAERTQSYALYPGEPAPEGGICGTPLVHDELLFIGTTDGMVSAVALGRSTLS